MGGPDGSEQQFDIQAWLEHAANEHMRSKVRSALDDPLSTKLPQRVRQTVVTAVTFDNGMIEMVEFKAVGRDSTEFTTWRSVGNVGA